MRQGSGPFDRSAVGLEESEFHGPGARQGREESRAMGRGAGGAISHAAPGEAAVYLSVVVVVQCKQKV